MNTIIKIRNLKTISQTFCLAIALFLCTGCEKFLDTEGPNGQILSETVFEDEATANAAITTLYAKLRDEVLVTGNTYGLGFQMGLYADELEYYGASTQPFETFFSHQILASDVLVSRTWNGSYNLIYMANAAIEGIENSQTLASDAKEQLLGEALFVRAFVHFYLVNLFGDIPYITTTDYDTNRQISRMSETFVYESIVADLMEAKSKMGTEYLSNERIRANSYVASALLARVYLYTEQWTNAEIESSYLINNLALYQLGMDLDQVFSKTSTSAILQLKTKIANQPTTEANTLVFTMGPPPSVALSAGLVNDMEANDLRRMQWIGQVTNGSDNWYYSNKYRTDTNEQYSTVFRLAEQYLIRAEARARTNDFSGGLNDLNALRLRAGLATSGVTSSVELLEVILKERKLELFAEHGHRWFDIRRLGIAGEILSPIKPGWQATDILLPIPESELLMNSNLGPQNPGY